jgi:SH3-like domain-containing protein
MVYVVENPFSGMKTVESYLVVVRPSTPTTYVNLRWAPSKSAKIRTTRYNGDSLRVIAENKYWAQVMDDTTGECGFMMKSFLEKVEAGG